jgi:Protein of unknown function (DUF3014)
MNKAVPFLLLMILFAAATWYFFTRQPDAVHELPPAQLPIEEPVVALPAETRPEPAEPYSEPEPEPVVFPDPLPELNQSDSEIRQELDEVFGTDLLTGFLVKSQIISRFVSTVDSLTSRQVPLQINPVKPAEGEFVVEKHGERVILSPRNFARYDAYVSLLQNLDVETMIIMYRRYYPLFQQAWEENGGEGAFNTHLVEVIDRVLLTPDIPGPVYLYKPEAVYLFEEPELESMQAGQKILVRMGSLNATMVKQKLAEIRSRL